MAPKHAKPSRANYPRNTDKRFKCKYHRCKSFGFKTLGAKQRHEREQHRDEPTKCDYCNFTAKRRYQMISHMEIDHPEQRAYGATYALMGRASRSSISSLSSVDSAFNALQHLPTDHQSFSNHTTTFHHSPAHSSSGTGYIQHSLVSSYATDAHGGAYYDRRTSSVTDSQVQAHADQPPDMTAIHGYPFASSSGPGKPWGAPIIDSRPAPQSLSFGPSPPMNPPHHSANPVSQYPPYQPRLERDGQDYHSPYPSPSSQQGTIFSPSTRNP